MFSPIRLVTIKMASNAIFGPCTHMGKRAIVSQKFILFWGLKMFCTFPKAKHPLSPNSYPYPPHMLRKNFFETDTIVSVMTYMGTEPYKE